MCYCTPSVRTPVCSDCAHTLAARLTAATERAEKLHEANRTIPEYMQMVQALRGENKQLQARIDESQKQPALFFYRNGEDVAYRYAYQGFTNQLYAKPIIPPELANLQRENAELRKQLEEKVPEVWSVQNRSSVMLFSTEELADKYISAFPATVSGGLCKTRMQVMVPQPRKQP